MNKVSARPVPADAATPAHQVAVTIIGRKAGVVCSANFRVNFRSATELLGKTTGLGNGRGAWYSQGSGEMHLS